jgi:hypothetical protein
MLQPSSLLSLGCVGINPALDFGDPLLVLKDHRGDRNHAAYNECDNRNRKGP